MRKVIVAGSREFNNEEVLSRELCDLLLKPISAIEPLVLIEVVSGGDIGDDRMGEVFARRNNIPVRKFPIDWETHGKSAGYIRDVEMADYADELIVFWDGKSSDTKNMIWQAEKRKMKTTIIYY